MPPTSDPTIAVIGLITQLKISLRQISRLDVVRDAAVEAGRRQQRAISALRALGSSSVAPAAVKSTTPGSWKMAPNCVIARSTRQRPPTASLTIVFAAQAVLDAENHRVVAQLVPASGAIACRESLTFVVSRISVPRGDAVDGGGGADAMRRRFAAGDAQAVAVDRVGVRRPRDQRHGCCVASFAA